MKFFRQILFFVKHDTSVMKDIGDRDVKFLFRGLSQKNHTTIAQVLGFHLGYDFCTVQPVQYIIHDYYRTA